MDRRVDTPTLHFAVTPPSHTSTAHTDPELDDGWCVMDESHPQPHSVSPLGEMLGLLKQSHFKYKPMQQLLLACNPRSLLPCVFFSSEDYTRACDALDSSGKA